MDIKIKLKLLAITLLLLYGCNGKKISVGMGIDEVKDLAKDKKQIALTNINKDGYSSFDIELSKTKYISFTYKDGKVTKITVCENADQPKGKQKWVTQNEVSF